MSSFPDETSDRFSVYLFYDPALGGDQHLGHLGTGRNGGRLGIREGGWLWPLAPKIDRATLAFLKFDMRHGA